MKNNKNCVSPDTKIEWTYQGEPETLNIGPIGSFMGLVSECACTDQIVGKHYHQKSDKVIEIATIDPVTRKKYFSALQAVVYKGKQTGYKVNVTNDDGHVATLFKCTKDHEFYDYNSQSWKTAEELYPSFTATTIVATEFEDDEERRKYNGPIYSGKLLEITLEETTEEFPALDILTDAESYITCNILSRDLTTTEEVIEETETREAEEVVEEEVAEEVTETAEEEVVEETIEVVAEETETTSTKETKSKSTATA